MEQLFTNPHILTPSQNELYKWAIQLFSHCQLGVILIVGNFEGFFFLFLM